MIALESRRLGFNTPNVLKEVEREVLMIERVTNDFGGSTAARQVHAMYATRLMTEIYHLVQPGGQHTLCGLRISRLTSERKTNTLQLVSDVPAKLTICKHCERIQGQENNLATDLRG